MCATPSQATERNIVTTLPPTSEPNQRSEIAKPPLAMETLKAQEDISRGIAGLAGDLLNSLDPSGVVRKRLWTRADFMHVHAVSGAYFMLVGFLWLLQTLTGDPSTSSLALNSPLFFSLLIVGLVNSFSAIPMARFSSNVLFDVRDLKANGFIYGGAGLTTMCLWMSWWFSGTYPSALHMIDRPLFTLWVLLCVGTSINWEAMLAVNLEKTEQSERKKTIALLYRIASWPNLSQLLFVANPCIGGVPWLEQVLEQYPSQATVLCHYGISSALCYSLSMFAETLRDRKLISLQVDLGILLLSYAIPLLVVIQDTMRFGPDATIWPTNYWIGFS